MRFSKKDWLIAACMSLLIHFLAVAAFGVRETPILIEKTPLKISFVRPKKQSKSAKLKKSPIAKKIEPKKIKPIKAAPKKVVPKKIAKKKKPIIKKEITPDTTEVKPQEASLNHSPQLPAKEQITTNQQQIAAQETINYKQLVAGMIARARRYPKSARRRNKQGVGVVTFTLRANGSIASAKLIHGSGVRSLDKEMVAMVHRASPFPSFPEGLRKSSLQLTIPINFKLK